MLLGKEYKRIAQASESGDALLVTDYSMDGIFKGVEFLIQKNFTIAASGTLNILVDFTTYTGLNKRVVIKPASYTTTSGPVVVSITRGTNYTGGTPIPAYNLNTLIGGTSKTTFTYGATGTVKGTVTQELVIGYGSTNQSSGGGTMTTDVLILRGNTGKTLIEVTNNSGAEITFNFLQELFEI
jgi:hypothetical protein